MDTRKHIGRWKVVDVNRSDFCKRIEGLVGIEELKDYDLDIIRKSGDDYNICNKHKGKKTTVKRKTKESEYVSLPLSTKQGKEKLFKKSKRTERKPDFETNEEFKRYINGEETQVDDKLITEMKAWSGLNVSFPILKALAEMGFNEPTEIQALVLPPAILGHRDILGAAETGSGKTLAFGIPIIHGIFEEKIKETSSTLHNRLHEDNYIASDELGTTNTESITCVRKSTFASSTKLYALVLTPTRELAIQVHNHLIAAAKHTSIKVAVLVGGMASQKQERLLKQGPEIVVATPGRLWELIEEGNPHLAQVSDIRFLAIDETDRMLERGHFLELQTLLEHINTNEMKKRQRQNFVFSATLTLVHEPPKHSMKGKHKLRVTPGQKLQGIISMLGITNPKVIDVTHPTGTASNLTEAHIICPLEDKDLYLYYILQCHPGRTVVFCNSISCVRRLTQLLNLLQCMPLPLHANMMQRQRLKNLERFRNNANSLLLATDVAARGLDIPNVEHVIHYQVPRTSEGYVHRSGRTARAQKEGVAILLIEPSEISYYTRMCRTLGRDKHLPVFAVEDRLFLAIKKRVQLARELDKMELALRRNSAQTGWFQKAMKETDVILDKNELPEKFSDSTTSKVKREISAKRKQLNALLTRPVISKSASNKYRSEKGNLNKNSIKQILNMEHKPGMFNRKNKY